MTIVCPVSKQVYTLCTPRRNRDSIFHIRCVRPPWPRVYIVSEALLYVCSLFLLSSASRDCSEFAWPEISLGFQRESRIPPLYLQRCAERSPDTHGILCITLSVQWVREKKGRPDIWSTRRQKRYYSHENPPSHTKHWPRADSIGVCLFSHSSQPLFARNA